jgi:hypothetical protein
MSENIPRKISFEIEPDSIRAAMELAWQDHHHARDQTWRALQLEAALAAGLVGVDWQIQNAVATIAAGILVVIATIFGMLISLHHRKVEIRKFTHIVNCEEALGLHREDLLPPELCKIPREISFGDAFRPSVNNTATFILRAHIALMLFAVIFVVARIVL